MEGGPPSQQQQQQQQAPFDPSHAMQMMYPPGAAAHYPGGPPSGMYPPADQMLPPPHPDMMPPPLPGALMGPMYDEKYLEHLSQLNDKLNQIRQDIEKMPKNDIEQFKEQKLPLARIKKIMKSDEDVRMISAEAPILFAKACEMFIIEMTHKAYYYAARNNRKTLQRNDIAAAITDTEIYDFLLDIMPRDEMIQNSKDKMLTQYQMQLLDDVCRMQELQRMQQQLGPGSAAGGQPIPPQPHFPMQHPMLAGTEGASKGVEEDEEDEESVSKDEESKKN